MDEKVPSYEESEASFGQDRKQPLHASPPPSLLPQHLAETRTQRIQSILTAYVDPLLFSQGSDGLYKTTFVLVPSSVASLQDAAGNAAAATPQEPQVMGFPSDEVVKLVRLQGQGHTMEFWRQPAVIAELDSALRARLAASGHRIYEQPTDAAAVSEHEPEQHSQQQQQPAPAPKGKLRRSFWRLAGGSDDTINDQKLGWRAEEPADEARKIPTGLVKVTIAWKEVALRISNEMGLYDTQRGPALCLTVEVGS
ncbi:hypothetical protein H112_05320 [Trichophyton rubrum D6]|uniref:Uncharacterized protein n=4 Tax=Trichophyton TaxID=5550 RepID=A0A178EPP3_TRIRU|nr:uncharacterized protein TERG_03069 [Trichophyton rubrum CBS 118892]EZF19734.1 hypothetical protein H100_05344 [Trichophyton rubrum MR850]EZF51476.1 hypothetical protein H103_05334 [Trichophyton rubrum CBS 288.86]EZF61980.1 hypothetical protein H104_05323 [Trichophyton rubrum CBS 289.86]EZF72596.1 hypothetical protein H105_05352 [Trichophyton soudanense CBS 452.61]EZF83283.1 hypothetical protein H110_05330 [Trichophyton rubrum MR1448]EZF94020.1 hypothetical protein H113_05368 [Trichophyton 